MVFSVKNLTKIGLIIVGNFWVLLAIETTQTLSLQSGWNAVWLEVDPVYTSGEQEGVGKAPDLVFSDAAILTVATPNPESGQIEFISDASDGFFNSSDWQVWHRNSELNATTLGAVRGYRAYLIKTSAAVNLSITGTAEYRPLDWQPNSYNLVGFGLTSTPTFAQFFADHPTTHPTNRIFRLDASSGNWLSVSDSEAMTSHQAYWIYSEGQSTFNGAVQVSFPDLGGVNFTDLPANTSFPDPNNNTSTISVATREVVLTNPSTTNRNVRLTKVLPNTGASSASDELRIYDLQPSTTSSSFEPAGGLINATDFAINAQSTTVITLGANRNWTSGLAKRENLYRIEFDYHYLWFPMSAENSDLTGTTQTVANPASAGLWIGEIVMDQVSSITEAGRPLAETSSQAPLRVILHADASGNVTLLSHVMLMQTKTADETVAAEQVLVLNEAKIPFYEGVEERAGKKVGIRLESVGYDMPRLVDLTSQSALLANVASYASKTEAQVTEADIAAYLAQLSTRDPLLSESYAYKFPLEGSLEASSLVQTGATPLILDAFHRSNPFRHAFHPQHGTGKHVSRAMTFHFDPGTSSDVLTGTYNETVTGLAAFPLNATGTFQLTRATTTASLVE